MSFEFEELALPGVFEITPKRHEDERGFFSEVFSQAEIVKHGICTAWVQDNHSLSRPINVLRGLHFQRPPFAQDKLVRVTRGAILDVAVDIRQGSPTFAKWVSLVVSSEKWNQLLVPKGFAHGFLTLEPDTEVLYKVSQGYSPEHDAVIRYDDPDIAIDWQLGGAAPVLSAKDDGAGFLRDQDTGFIF